ncbi:MAG: hypothetical protein MZV70_39470 [Desulfobacterales bacterium]|nr:hypothetical protein [Desulfobacterales bacterium]
MRGEGCCARPDMPGARISPAAFLARPAARPWPGWFRARSVTVLAVPQRRRG